MDLVIKLNTNRPLQREVQHDLDGLLRIRMLTVDITIFAETPSRVWAEFPHLEVLTIVFYPRPDIIDYGFEEEQWACVKGPQFLRPKRDSKFGKRAAWILASATKILMKIQSKVPRWKIPTIKVVIRTCGVREFDSKIEEQPDGEDAWAIYPNPTEANTSVDEPAPELRFKHRGSVNGIPQDEPAQADNRSVYSQDEVEEEGDDSLWYEQAGIRMACKIRSHQIRKLKYKYHPGTKKVDIDGLYDEDDIYVTDSEGEEGKVNYGMYAAGIVYEDSDDD